MDVILSNELRHDILEFSIAEAAGDTDDVSFAGIAIKGIDLDSLYMGFVPEAFIEAGNQAQTEKFAPDLRFGPGQAFILLIPDLEDQEMRRQVQVMDRMLGEEILPADPPAGRYLMPDLTMKTPEPVSGRMGSRVDRPRVKTIPIYGCLLTVHLDRDDDLLAFEALQGGNDLVIARDIG